MPKPYPREFRDDVVRVAQQRDSGVTISQVAADFGISETCLQNWLKAAEIDSGARAAVTSTEAAELRELRKRNRLLEQGNTLSTSAVRHHRSGVTYPCSSPQARDIPEE